MDINNNESKVIDIKNCTCYYFDDIISISDVVLGNILLDEKSYINISICDVAYKAPNGGKPLGITFDKVEGYSRKKDGTKYLVLFRSDEKYDRIYHRIIYLITKKSNITDIYYLKYMKSKINSDDVLCEKTLCIMK